MSDSVLDHYRALERAAGEMLEAARRDDWARVAEIERSLASRAPSAQAQPEGETLSPAAERERLRIVHRIIVTDGEIRRLAQPWEQALDAVFPASAPGRWAHLHALSGGKPGSGRE